MRRRASNRKSRISALAFVLVGVAALSAQDKSKVHVNRTAPSVKPVAMMPSFSDPPPSAEITRARVFEEPLLPLGEPSTQENRELAELLMAYLEAGVPDGTQALDEFVKMHASSPWRASLLTDLGVVWRRTGHFSKAYNAWYLAWELTKDLTDRNGRAVADKALGEYVELNARLGRFDELQSLFEEVKGRDIHGAATEKVSGAQQALWIMRNLPEHAFRCGPLGLDAVLAVGATNYTTPSKVAACPSTKQGTSLLMMRDLAKEIGAPMTMATRPPGADVIVPALVHWKMGHFAALVAKERGRYLLKDPTFGDELWVTQAVFDDEASGYVLVRTQVLPERWRAVSDEEGRQVWGKGILAGLDNTDPGPSPTSGGPPPGPCTNSAVCCPGGGGGAGGGGGPCGPGPRGMPVLGIQQMLVSVTVTDIPVWYTPPKGPVVEFHATYNQREAFQPQTFWYANLGTKWTHDWLSYITDDPSNPAAALTVYQRGGGQESVTGYNGATQSYSPTIREQAVVTRTATSPVRYERQLANGAVEVFAQPDGAATFPRKVFLTESRDPQGNAITFTYDASLRLVAITDALGQVTTLAYGNVDPLKITQVTDPFGRTATMTYDGSGRLQSITDLLGLTSSFTYGASDVITAMTTPYGTTTVTSGEGLPDSQHPGAKRWAQVTDPLGGKERVEYGGATVFTAQPVPPNGYDNPLNSNHATVYWDKRAMAVAPGDPASATEIVWALVQNGQWMSAAVPIEIKKPLENGVWYSYQGSSTGTEGTVRQLTGIGRVLDDGSSQVWTYASNSRGRMIKSVDPLGRETDYVYDATGLDLLQVKQKRGGTFDILETRTFNSQHEPLTITDAAGQTTTYTYNANGQVLTVTNAKNETTTYVYDANGYLLSITGALAGSTTTYAHDAYGRISTVTDSEGYAVTTTYDAANRPVQVAYPDGTLEQTIYDRLDLRERRDRLGRITTSTYDANRRLVTTRDPLGRRVVQEWCVCGSIDALVDGNGNRTHWDYDTQARLTMETRADGATTHYSYENTTPRLKQVTDAKGQVTTLTYRLDDALQQAVYTNAQVSTPAVTFSYDASYPRVTTMVDGTGTTTYNYFAVASGQLGAAQLQSVDGPIANDTITYTYDELRRVVSRAVDGVAMSMTYDAIGRRATEINAAGTFNYAYVGKSARIQSVSYPNGQTSTYSYYGHTGDDRLQTILHQYPNLASLSRFDYTYDAAGNVLSWQQQADNAAPTKYGFSYDSADELLAATKQTTDPTPTILKRYVYAYDRAGNRTSEQVDDTLTGATYNNRNELVSQQAAGGMLFAGLLSEPASVTVAGKSALVKADNSFSASAPIVAGTSTVTIIATDPSGNTTTKQYQVSSNGPNTTFMHDANGNLTSDGTRTFEWDAVDRLVAVNIGSHRTEFTYNGGSHRQRTVEKESSVIVGDQFAIWSGAELVETRDTVPSSYSRRFYRHAIQENGAVTYITEDHLQSVRDVTDASGALQSRYDYAPFGAASQVVGSNPAALQFTAMPANVATGLLLMEQRAYDPSLGRWLNEDPIGWKAGPNLYSYVFENPTRWIDPKGTFPILPPSFPSLPRPLPNGNWTSRTGLQDYICSLDILGSSIVSDFANNNRCTLNCCIAHDQCYERNRCNMSSWLTFGMGSCGSCNLAVVGCVLQGQSGPKPCTTCTSNGKL